MRTLLIVTGLVCTTILAVGCGSAKAAGTNDPPATDLTNCKLTTTGSNINLVCDSTVISSVTIPTGTTPWQPYTGGMRLQVTSDPGETWLGADGAKYSTTDSQSSFYDTQLGVNCSLGLGSDGQRYCLPDQTARLYGVGVFYADSSCSMSVASYLTTCGAAAPKYISASSTTTCGPTTYTFYQLGNPITTVYFLSGTTCTVVPSTSLPANYQFVQVGAEVPVSTFVAFTKQ